MGGRYGCWLSPTASASSADVHDERHLGTTYPPRLAGCSEDTWMPLSCRLRLSSSILSCRARSSSGVALRVDDAFDVAGWRCDEEPAQTDEIEANAEEQGDRPRPDSSSEWPLLNRHLPEHAKAQYHPRQRRVVERHGVGLKPKPASSASRSDTSSRSSNNTARSNNDGGIEGRPMPVE